MRRVLLFLTVQTLVLADPRCSACHQSIVDRYGGTGKARSVSKPRAEVQMQRSWMHEFSGRRAGIQWQDGRLFHFLEYKGRQVTYETAWAVGSGDQAKNYLVQIGDALFHSPLAWYSSRLIWDMAPGYAVDGSPDFYRPATKECLVCHVGSANAIPGTVNRYGTPALPEPAIGCAGCHGDPSAHLAKAAAGNIVNPGKLDAVKRDSICESCHLTAEARVPNPGRTFSDFRPGLALEEVFSVYVARKNSNDTILRVSSQVEQMALSRCYTESAGRLWCGSCHDSHGEPAEKQKPSYYRDRCMACHNDEPAATHRSRYGDDCVQCHMGRVRGYDGGHAALTDHWIRKREREDKFLDRGELLRPWREPPERYRNRNFALAYIANAERTRSLKRLREGVRHLNAAIEEGHRDGEFASLVGTQFLRQKAPDKALPWFAAAVQDQPDHSARRLRFAAALAVAGNMEEAKQQALEAIRLEPMLADAYSLLAQVEPMRAEYWREQYRKLAPRRF